MCDLEPSALEVVVSYGAAAIPPTLKLLAHHRASVREQAAAVLCEIGVPSRPVVQALQLRLGDRDSDVRTAATRALKMLEERAAEVKARKGGGFAAATSARGSRRPRPSTR